MTGLYIHTVSSLSITKGGPSRSITGLCNALSTIEKNISIITIKNNEAICYPSNTNIIVYQANKSLFDYNLFFELNSVNEKSPISIVHDHGLWMPSNFWSARWAQSHNIPLILSPRGMLEAWSLSHKSPKKKLALFLYQSRILQQVSVFFATAKEEAQQIRKLGFKQPIAIIPNGVEIPKEFYVHDRSPSAQKKILFLSRIHPKKGLINLVHAWSLVKNPEWKIIIAGNDEGNHLQEILTEVTKLQMKEDFEFIGSVEGNEKNDAYKNADLFILPTFSENFGIVVAEALSYGVPVITTTGTPWHSLIDNHCGWWIDPTVEDIASALQEAMSLSDEQRRDMGKRGIAFVKNDFSWESIAKQTIAVYNWILGKSEKPDCIMD